MILNKSMYKSQKRSYYGSIGAGIMPICKKTGRILISLRSFDVEEPYTWGIFGGKLDIDEGVDETIEIASLRELNEETSYSGSIKLIPSYVFRDENFSYYNYIGIVEDEFNPVLNWENDQAVWYTLDELISLPNKHFGLKALLKDNESMNKIRSIIN